MTQIFGQPPHQSQSVVAVGSRNRQSQSAVDFIGIHSAVTVPHGANDAFDDAADAWRTISDGAIP